MLRARYAVVSARCDARGLTFSYLPDSVPMRASFWHRARARAFSSLFLPTTVRTTNSRFIAISCIRSIKIPRYARIVTCVISRIVLFSYRVVAIPLAYNPLAARDRRLITSECDPKDLGAFYLQATNAKFWDEKNINFIHAYMQINLNSPSLTKNSCGTFFPRTIKKVLVEYHRKMSEKYILFIFIDLLLLNNVLLKTIKQCYIKQ